MNAKHDVLLFISPDPETIGQPGINVPVIRGTPELFAKPGFDHTVQSIIDRVVFSIRHLSYQIGQRAVNNAKGYHPSPARFLLLYRSIAEFKAATGQYRRLDDRNRLRRNCSNRAGGDHRPLKSGESLQIRVNAALLAIVKGALYLGEEARQLVGTDCLASPSSPISLGRKCCNFSCCGAGVDASKAVSDEKALTAILCYFLKVEVPGDDVAHPLGGSSIDPQCFSHFVEC